MQCRRSHNVITCTGIHCWVKNNVEKNMSSMTTVRTATGIWTSNCKEYPGRPDARLSFTLSQHVCRHVWEHGSYPLTWAEKGFGPLSFKWSQRVQNVKAGGVEQANELLNAQSGAEVQTAGNVFKSGANVKCSWRVNSKRTTHRTSSVLPRVTV